MTFLVKCLFISQYNSYNTVSGKSGTGKYSTGNKGTNGKAGKNRTFSILKFGVEFGG